MTTVAQPPRQCLSEGGYEIEIAVQGYPGKAVCHGGLGWSTIALLRGHGRVALIDTGSFGQRQFSTVWRRMDLRQLTSPTCS